MEALRRVPAPDLDAWPVIISAGEPSEVGAPRRRWLGLLVVTVLLIRVLGGRSWAVAEQRNDGPTVDRISHASACPPGALDSLDADELFWRQIEARHRANGC